MTSQPAMGFSVVALIALIIPLGCLVGLVWLWYRILRKPKHQHAVCGHCQYIVEGLPTMFCPECGSDFRKVGIVTPGRQATIKPTFFLPAWTVLLTPLALLISVLVVVIGPQRVTVRSSVSLSPVSKSFGSVTLLFSPKFTVAASALGRGASIRVSSASRNGVTLHLPNSAPGWVADQIGLTIAASGKGPPSVWATPLRLFPRTGSYQYAGTSGNAFTQTVMEDWFAVCGLTTDAPDTGADAAELFALVNAYAKGQASFRSNRYVSKGVSSSGAVSRPASGMVGGVMVFWLLAYISGIVLYYRWRGPAAHAVEAIPAPV